MALYSAQQPIQHSRSRGIAPIAVLAALSVAGLLIAAGIQAGKQVQTNTYVPVAIDPSALKPKTFFDIKDADRNGTPDWEDELMRAGIQVATSTGTSSIATDPLAYITEDVTFALIDGYLSLKSKDHYTPETGKQLADSIASAIKAPPTFTPHTEAELVIDSGASVARILAYRSDMRAATEPLISNDYPEFYYFAKFIETEDPYWLTELTRIADRYREAEQNLLKVNVPESAVTYHLRAVNAAGKFRKTLERLVQFSRDPIAQLALIRTYNEAEREMLLAFDALGKFYARSVQ